MPDHRPLYVRPLTFFLIWSVVSAVSLVVDSQMMPQIADAVNAAKPVPSPWTVSATETHITALKLVGLIACVLALTKLFAFVTIVLFRQRGKPAVEGLMVSRIYMLIGFVIIALMAAYGFGTLAAISAFFATFGGMLMGFSLQAPISGFAAWVLVSVMRPFRPGDRVQFPNLGLVGDVKDVGLMYTVLDQVGGSVGSEEAVGRNILIPNAMLFSQVAINYTVTQESAFMLDEVVARITFDSNWEKAEQILLNAAREITADIIKATGMQPYIRSDLYDYGVYLRLRYQTSVKDRAEIAYKIGKRIFEGIQGEPTVDHAIPFLYSARAGRGILTMRAENGMSGSNGHGSPEAPDVDAEQIRDIELAHISNSQKIADLDVVEQLAQSIATHGLLQPIVVLKNPRGRYDVVAGQMRLEACRRLGWKTIPAVVKGADEIDSRLTVEHLDRSSSGK